MSDRVRLALLGTGGISQAAHIPAWKQIPEVEIVALAEPNPLRRQRALELLGDPKGARIATYADGDELLAAVQPDLVDVTIPPGPAKERSIRAALAAGCHVTCQKPFTLDEASAKALVQEAAERGRILSVNQQARWAGAFARARQRIVDGSLGELRTIQLWADFRNGGPMQWLYYSVHSFDLIRFWAGREPKRVLAWHKPQTAQGHYLLTVWLDFDDVLAAQIWDEMSSSTTLRWGFRLMGSGGTLRGHEAFGARMFPAEVIFTPAGTLEETVEPVPERYIPDAFRAYFAALIAAIAGRGPVPTPAADNLNTLRLAFAAHEAAAMGAWVAIAADDSPVPVPVPPRQP
jgi:predicted dehydrogenase